MTEDEWLTGNDVRGMLWFLALRATERQLLLFAVACCQRIANLLIDPRSQRVIEAAERLAEGRTTYARLVECADDAELAWADRMRIAARAGGAFSEKSHTPEYRHARRAAHAADAARRFRDRIETAVDWLTCAVRNAAGDVSCDALGSVRAPADNPEREYHRRLLVDIFGNPFRPVAADPRWLTSPVLDLARAMYDGRDFGPMTVLADALEEAGCGEPDVLAHCRGDGPHARGCWVVDLVVGKT